MIHKELRVVQKTLTDNEAQKKEILILKEEKDELMAKLSQPTKAELAVKTKVEQLNSKLEKAQKLLIQFQIQT